MTETNSLKGKSALVTGGSSGIGKAIAQALVDLGVTVAISGRDAEALERVAGELGVTAIQGDVGVEADAERMVETLVESAGSIDILINNAGFGRFAPLLETTADDMESVWRTNVLGAFLVGRAAARRRTPRAWTRRGSPARGSAGRCARSGRSARPRRTPRSCRTRARRARARAARLVGRRGAARGTRASGGVARMA